MRVLVIFHEYWIEGPCFIKKHFFFGYMAESIDDGLPDIV